MYWKIGLLSLHQSCNSASIPEHVVSTLFLIPFYRTPETFDLVSTTIDRDARKNLDQVSKVLTQITSGSEFDDDSPIYVPINEFVRQAITQMTAWLLEGGTIVATFRSFLMSLQSLTCRTRKLNSMPMNFWMPLYSPSPYIYHPMRYTPCTDSWLSIRITWLARSSSLPSYSLFM